jgi:hypothetical protein
MKRKERHQLKGNEVAEMIVGARAAFEAAAFGIGDLAAGEPDAAQVGMAVRGTRRRSAEIGLAVCGARRTGQRHFDPLGLRGEGEAQGEEQARNEIREFHYGSFVCSIG